MRGVPRARRAISRAPAPSMSTPTMLDELEPAAQRAGDEAGARCRADEREARKIETYRLRAGPLADDEIELPLLHRGIQNLLNGAREAMDLVDEEDIGVLEVREDGGEITGSLEDRARRLTDVGAHRARDDVGHGRLAEARRSREQEVPDRLSASQCRVEDDAEMV